MSDELSYPSLKCVLEYLEPNRRIHITSRSLSIQKFEKSIPLHINDLQIQDHAIKLNNIKYHVQNHHEEIEETDPLFEQRPDKPTPGDIKTEDCYDTWVRKITSLRIDLLESGTSIWHRFNRVPDGIIDHKAFKTFTTSFLGNRKEIQVDHVVFPCYVFRFLRLPEGLKLKISYLDPILYDFRTFLPIIDPSSFPLREYHTNVFNVEHLNHEVVRTAEKLVLRNAWNFNRELPEDHWLIAQLHKFANRSLVLEECPLKNHHAIVIVRGWLENWKEVGTNLTIEVRSKNELDGFLKAIREEFNVEYVKLKEPDERQIVSCPCLSIPVNLTSEILIYAIQDSSKHWLHMRVMAIGSSIPTIYEEPANDEAGNEAGSEVVENPTGNTVKGQNDDGFCWLAHLFAAVLIIFMASMEIISALF